MTGKKHTARDGAKKKLRIKRVYEPHVVGDGERVLVDRLWPRGASKSSLRDALWLKEIGPSNELRKWFGHRPERWQQFRARYRAELKQNPEMLRKLHALLAEGPVTLLYSAKDEEHNQAVVLAEYLRAQSRSPAPSARRQ